MGIKRRAVLIGGAAALGGGLFGIQWADRAARSRAVELTTHGTEANFLTWMKIAEDDTVTLYSPHIDFGQGSQTALAQMLADELDADLSKVVVEAAPADPAFGNTPLAQGFIGDISGKQGLIDAIPTAWLSLLSRNMPMQMTGGSSAIRATGQYGMRVVGASARLALIEEAASRLGVSANELTTAGGRVTHAGSGKSLRYGELAAGAARRSLSERPKLKDRKDYRYIGKPVARLDIPTKVTGAAKYGIDFTLPEMRVATLMMAPVQGGTLESVDPAPALAVRGVEKVINLDQAVVVVAKGYWQALKGVRALKPKFTDGGHAAVTTASIFEAQAALNAQGKPLVPPAGAKVLEAEFKVPFLHHAMMEPYALTAHHHDGKLEVWGGVQDPLNARNMVAKASGLKVDDVTFHPMIMGGGFGRRFPPYSQIIEQVAKLAMQVPYPVKLIWSREEDVKHGAYRPQVSARLQAAVGGDGKIAAWTSDYAQPADARGEALVPYTVAQVDVRHHKHQSNLVDGYWRSVNASQHGFFNETFIDELAAAAGQDPYQFRRNNLPSGSRHQVVLDEVAKRAGWGTPLAAGRGRGIALVMSFGTIVAEVVEASMGTDGRPVVHKVTAVVDCGTTVNPLNAEAQVQGAIVMGLSSAIGEAITVEKGEVQQSNFTNYPVLKLAQAPVIDVHFIESDGRMGGLGEPGVPPVAPALANALFAVTGKRIRQLPMVAQTA